MTGESAAPPIDLVWLARNTGGHRDFELHLFRLFVEQTSEKLRSVEAALSGSNYAQIREDAHSIKGTSSNIGASRLSELAASLEGSMKNGEHALVEAMVAEVTLEYTRVLQFIDDYERTGRA